MSLFVLVLCLGGWIEDQLLCFCFYLFIFLLFLRLKNHTSAVLLIVIKMCLIKRKILQMLQQMSLSTKAPIWQRGGKLFPPTPPAFKENKNNWWYCLGPNMYVSEGMNVATTKIQLCHYMCVQMFITRIIILKIVEK